MHESCLEASACNINVALFKAMDAARATNRYTEMQCSAVYCNAGLCKSAYLNLKSLWPLLSYTLVPFLFSFTLPHFFLLVFYSYRYLTEAEPWKMKGENESRRPAIVRTTLEALYAFTHLLAPVLPIAAQIGADMSNMM